MLCMRSSASYTFLKRLAPTMEWTWLPICGRIRVRPGTNANANANALISIRERAKEALGSTHLSRVHDGVETGGDDGPTAPEDPVLRMDGRHERRDGQEFGEHRKDRSGSDINDCVEVGLTRVDS